MDKGGKQEFIIRVCCVIAAFVLWLFITSTENPISDYKIKNIPVQLINMDILDDSNLTLVPGQELEIDLSIKGANTSILLDKKAEDFTVVADLSAYALKVGEQKIPIEIRRSPDNINVVNSDSLFIKVNLDKHVETKLPINFNISGVPKQGYYASKPQLSKEKATVIGGSKFVSTVTEIIVEENIQDAESDVIKSYKLIPVDAKGKEVSEVSVKPSHIDVKIPIRKTKTVGVKVKTIGELNTKFILESIKVLPERFDITGSAEALNNIENLNTESIDLSKISKTTTVDVKVTIPEGLSLVSGASEAVVKVQINVTKIVQKSISLDIKDNNLDTNYEVSPLNKKCELVVSASEAVINSLDLSKFSASVYLINLVEGEHTIAVLVPMPEGIKLISSSPDKILVTITKKQTEVTNNNDNTSK
ncbi:CdaR family protein [Clostridium sp.]|jgi:YbbR domain-containing protein|uniref:CdaR family protein n=1 Tax=Clostridium sp. TaxID=1506 RepID=UPI003EEA1423